MESTPIEQTEARAPSEATARSRVGTVLAVCIGPGGIPKSAVESAQVGPSGLAGDRHRYRSHGGLDRAVCLFSIEDYESLWRDGVVAPAPGAFGENLLTRGLEYKELRPGDHLAVGPQVLLQIHGVREPCGTLKSVDPRFPELMLGRSGFVCRVQREGVLEPGHSIQRIEAASFR